MSASAQMWRVIEKQRTRREQNYRRDKSSTRADDETFFSFRRPSSSHFVTPKPLLARPSSVQARNKTSSRKWNIKRTTQLFRSIVLLSLSLSPLTHSLSIFNKTVQNMRIASEWNSGFGNRLNEAFTYSAECLSFKRIFYWMRDDGGGRNKQKQSPFRPIS